jgi:hypothetical protein
MCCETTARVGANLGFEMSFARRTPSTSTTTRWARSRRRDLSGDGGEPRSGGRRVLTAAEAIVELRAIA